MASHALDSKVYGKLLAKTVPAVITTDEEHATALGRVSELAMNSEGATPEEVALMQLWATLIEDYERKRWPRRRLRTTPAGMLAFLMAENGLKQSDLADIASQSNISAMLRGKRVIGKAIAEKLAKRFHVAPALFL